MATEFTVNLTKEISTPSSKVWDALTNPEIIKQYFSEALLPGMDSRHDAYYDLQASIAELSFYRQHLLRPL